MLGRIIHACPPLCIINRDSFRGLEHLEMLKLLAICTIIHTVNIVYRSLLMLGSRILMAPPGPHDGVITGYHVKPWAPWEDAVT